MPLVGTEIVYVQGVQTNGQPGAIQFPTTTGAIATLAADTVLPPIVNTAITTTGNGTLTAAGLVGGLITRTGPTANYSDATDTALNIVAALTAYVANESQIVRIKNATGWAQTITAGVGVTFIGQAVIPAYSEIEYLMTINSATAVTIQHVSTSLIYGTSITRCNTQLDKTSSVVLANVTGLTQTVVPGTYRFRAVLPGTAGGTGGIQYAFNYTTTALTSIEATGIGYTAAAVAVQHTTTTTTQTALFSEAAAVIMTILEGTMVVATGGTIDLQMAQNTSNGTTSSTYVGATMEFVRIA